MAESTTDEIFHLIRDWAEERGLYESGDPKNQTLKLLEEVGEISAAIIRGKEEEAKDGIGDAVVVLTNLAHLLGTDIESCIVLAYSEIKDRKGKMLDGNFVKEEDHDSV